jgi:hypothetical protein
MATSMTTVASSTVLFSLLLLFTARQRKSTRAAHGNTSRLIFLGSGCSGGTPIALCLLGLIPGRPSNGCDVCRSAHGNPSNPNHRRNPSVLLQNPSRTYNALIDCGKTFREAALTWFPKFGVKGISAIILTREFFFLSFVALKI